MKLKFTGLMILFAFATTGCIAKQSISPILTTEIPSSTKKLELASTPTPSMTFTLMPSETSTPTSVEIQTETPTSKPSETSTPFPTRPPWDQFFASEDEQYIAKLYWHYEETGKQTIEISRKDGDILWIIPFQRKLPTGDPQRYLTIYKWSNDSEFLYFYYSFGYDGAHTLWNGFDLQKIDVETGKITQVIPSSMLVGFSISPSGEQIAFIRMEDDPRQLVIKNFSTGEIKRTSIHIETEEFVQGGWIEWALDEKKLVFHIAEGEWLRVYVLDVDTMQPDLVNESWVEEMWFQNWTEAGNLQFVTYPQYEVFEINIDTKEKTIIGTITPTPSP